MEEIRGRMLALLLLMTLAVAVEDKDDLEADSWVLNALLFVADFPEAMKTLRLVVDFDEALKILSLVVDFP